MTPDNRIFNVELAYQMAHAEKPYRDAAKHIAAAGSIGVQAAQTLEATANDASMAVATDYIARLQHTLAAYKPTEKPEVAIVFSINQDELFAFADRTGRTRTFASQAFNALLRESTRNPGIIKTIHTDPEAATESISLAFTKPFEDAESDILAIRQIGRGSFQMLAEFIEEQTTFNTNVEGQ